MSDFDRGPLRKFRIYHHTEAGELTHGEIIEAHQVCWPQRGIWYYSMGERWEIQAGAFVANASANQKTPADEAPEVVFYAETEGDWKRVASFPQATTSVFEVEPGGGAS